MDAGQSDSAVLSPFVRYSREEWCRLGSGEAALSLTEAQARELRQTIEHSSLEEVSEVYLPLDRDSSSRYTPPLSSLRVSEFSEQHYPCILSMRSPRCDRSRAPLAASVPASAGAYSREAGHRQP